MPGVPTFARAIFSLPVPRQYVTAFATDRNHAGDGADANVPEIGRETRDYPVTAEASRQSVTGACESTGEPTGGRYDTLR